jgi:hypothetical protein
MYRHKVRPDSEKTRASIEAMEKLEKEEEEQKKEKAEIVQQVEKLQNKQRRKAMKKSINFGGFIILLATCVWLFGYSTSVNAETMKI